MSDDAEDGASETMLARVERLLEQAKHFRRHGEDSSADAASARAETIMLKHSINAAKLAARRVANLRDELQTLSLPFDGIYRVALAPAFYDLVEAYGGAVRPLLIRHLLVYEVVVVGPEDELLRVRTLATSIRLQAFDGMERWWNRYDERFNLSRMEGYKARRQFMRSFVAGVIERVQRSRRTLLDEVDPGTALAVRDRRAVVDQFFTDNFNVQQVRSSVTAGTVDAMLAGLAAGRAASTDEPAVTGNRPQIER